MAIDDQNTIDAEPDLSEQAIYASKRFFVEVKPKYVSEIRITVNISQLSDRTSDRLRAAIEDEARLEVNVTVICGEPRDLCRSGDAKKRRLIIL